MNVVDTLHIEDDYHTLNCMCRTCRLIIKANTSQVQASFSYLINNFKYYVFPRKKIYNIIVKENGGMSSHVVGYVARHDDLIFVMHKSFVESNVQEAQLIY